MTALDWRAWLQRGLNLWRSSLQLRTVAITVALTTVAVTIISGYMSISIATNLYEDRKQQVLAEARQATANAQQLFDNAVTPTGAIDLDAANSAAQTTVLAAQSNPGGTEYTIRRTAGQSTAQIMQGTQTAELGSTISVP